jgi:hypothetical protein
MADAVLDDATVLALSSTHTLQAFGDGAVLLDTQSGQLYTCNASLEGFLRRVDGSRSLAAIVSDFREEFEVGEAEARADLAEIAGSLLDEGIVTIVGAPEGR